MLANTSKTEGGLSAQTLQSIGLFGALDDGSLTALCGRVKILQFEPGEQIYAQGEPGRALYVILSGQVTVSREHDHNGSRRNNEMARYHAGDWFGERAVLDVMPRPCSAHAVEATRAVKLCAGDLCALYKHNVKAYALLMMNIARQLARKLRDVEHRLEEAADNATPHPASGVAPAASGVAPVASGVAPAASGVTPATAAGVEPAASA